MTPRTDCTWEIKENIQGKVGGEAKKTYLGEITMGFGKRFEREAERWGEKEFFKRKATYSKAAHSGYKLGMPASTEELCQ